MSQDPEQFITAGETWNPIILDAGLPLVEQGSRLTMILRHPDQRPTDVDTGVVFVADQQRSDRLTWLVGTNDTCVVEPCSMQLPNGEIKQGFILGGSLEVVPISLNGLPIAEISTVEIYPGHNIEQVIAEQAGKTAIYYATSFDEELLATDLQHIGKVTVDYDGTRLYRRDH